MFSQFRLEKKRESHEEKLFIENGGRLLEKLIKSCDRKYNPFRIFSKEELQRATNNYDPHRISHKEGFYVLYKGNHEDRNVFVKKFKENEVENVVEWCINEVAIASQMNNHKNFLKLLGCCLETEIPVLVYEFAGNGNLSNYIHGYKKNSENPTPPLSWERKLRIATEIADAVAYLHTAVSKPIIHRDIKSRNIFLDEQYGVRLFDLSFCVSIPFGETYVEVEFAGTPGFVPHEILLTGRITEKSDVYSFGAVLLEIFTEKRAYQLALAFEKSEGNSMSNGSSNLVVGEEHSVQSWEMFVDQFLKANTIREGNTEQLMACLELALRCLKREQPEERPSMKSIAQELRRIKKGYTNVENRPSTNQQE